MSEATAGLRARWLQLSGNSRGALWMIASGVGFSVMAVGIKLLGHRLENFQIGFFRVVIGFVAILPFVAGSGLARLQTRHPGVHLVRAVFGLLAMYCSYYAIARMPLADYTGLSFTKPLFATLLAIAILGETVRWRRWTATLVGFLGVLVMVRPGAGTFQPAALAALVGFVLGRLPGDAGEAPAGDGNAAHHAVLFRPLRHRACPSARRSIPGSGRRSSSGCC